MKNFDFFFSKIFFWKKLSEKFSLMTKNFDMISKNFIIWFSRFASYFSPFLNILFNRYMSIKSYPFLKTKIFEEVQSGWLIFLNQKKAIQNFSLHFYIFTWQWFLPIPFKIFLLLLPSPTSILPKNKSQNFFAATLTSLLNPRPRPKRSSSNEHISRLLQKKSV